MNAKSKAFAFILVALTISGAFICYSVTSDNSSAETVSLDAYTLFNSSLQSCTYPAGTTINITNIGDPFEGAWEAYPFNFTLGSNQTITVTISYIENSEELDHRTINFYGQQANYTVSFNSMGGSAVASQSVSPGGYATAPANPTNGVKVFGGWYTDQACTQAFNFATPINANIILYAKWTDPTASVTSSHGNTTMTVGQLFSYSVSTNPSNATVSVSGANWLNVSGHTVYGTPTSPGTYNVTITSSASGYNNGSQSFTVTVSSVLAPSNAPSNGVIAYVR